MVAPVTKRQLRRLAYRVPRDPSLRPILHDALLEVYPENYERKIAFAERIAVEDRRPRVIVFDVRAMSRNRRHPSGGWLYAYYTLFAVYNASILKTNQLTSAEVPVYITRSQREGKES